MKSREVIEKMIEDAGERFRHHLEVNSTARAKEVAEIVCLLRRLEIETRGDAPVAYDVDFFRNEIEKKSIRIKELEERIENLKALAKPEPPENVDC